MNTPSPGRVPTTFGDPRPRRIAERASAIDFSTLDRSLVDEPAAEAPRTPVAVTPPAARGFETPRPLDAPRPSHDPIARRRVPWPGVLIGLLGVLAIGEAAAIVMLLKRPTPAAADSGAFVVETVPSGARVLVDDTDRGETPLRLTLPAGPHRVALTLGSLRHEFPVDLAAGATYAQRVEFAGAPPATAAGALEIRSQPSGAAVVVAGRPRGRTPLTVRDLTPGSHDVLMNLGGQQLRESVTVQSGTTVQLSAAFPATGSNRASGWIAVSSSVELTILENGQVIGTTRTPRIMVLAGRHTLELVNERLGFRASRTVEVADGRTAAVALELPKGTVSVNALPWAEVWVQDRKVGDTPLANLSLTIGTHQLLFRHPTLGERRQEVTITAAGAPARVSVDMRR